MLGQIRHTLLSDHNVRLPLEDVVAHEGDLLHLLLEGVGHGILSFKFHVGLTLALLVLEWAVQQDDPGVLNRPPHLGVGDILVNHDSVEHLAVLQSATGYLFNSGVSLDLEVELVLGTGPDDGLGGLDG